MTETEATKCQRCKGEGLTMCYSHNRTRNEYNDCFDCDSEAPARVTCECQER